ncbi:MAG TPA: 16S rRNA (cytosine(1402)-N(4))-methyltransferase RsmH [Actinomycetota bacterium]|nr:16S rRNA (cytosine(1402)-N(4))-methyltransferase RsmH [Actinomycetota bacterium]
MGERGATGASGPHEPVMVTEVVRFLVDESPRAGTVVDMTLGAGGHTEALLRAGAERVIGIDRDARALALADERLAVFGDRFRSVRTTFDEVDDELTGGPVDGVLYDLGVSSMQLDRADRGFSYRDDGPLDMRMAGADDDEPTAADLVNSLPERELADLIYELGGERRSRRIARAIVRRRPITSTDQLAGVIVGAVGRRPGGPHPARRTFQALRIAVNREIEGLAASLPQAVGLLAPGGRVVVIAYHSLEDRVVKTTFRDDERLTLLTKKPLRPSEDEVARNPRARSAILRAAERAEVAA